MELKAGTRLRSVVGSAEVIVVRAPGGDVDLRSGGRAMIPVDERPQEEAEPAPGFDEETLLGKRYVDADETLEVLCTKAGRGALSVGEALLSVKEAKPLPSSD